jgi:hypothetical protein
MSSLEITTIADGRNKSEKNMINFFLKEFRVTKNLIFFTFEHIFNPKYRMKRFEKLRETWSISELSALIEAFL